MGKTFQLDLRINFGTAKTSYTPLNLAKNVEQAKKYRLDEDEYVKRELDDLLEQIFLGARYKSSLKTNLGRSIAASKNAPLTVLLKGSKKPMIESGNLMFNAIKIKSLISGKNMKLSIYLDPKDPNYEIYKRLCSRDTYIKVSDRMKNMFNLLADVSEGLLPPSILYGRAAELYKMNTDWKRLSPDTTEIIIPQRNFWEVLAKSKKLELFMLRTMRRIMNITLNTVKNGRR